jgi:hypothetical protein
MERVITGEWRKECADGDGVFVGDIILEKSGGTDTTPVGRVVYCDERIASDTYLCNNFIPRQSIREMS